MYQSLYRKYRPIDFNDVSGQKIIIQTLKNQVLNNKLSHAYIFSGPRGTGKTSVAKILAKTVNCIKLNKTIPCNKCVSCTQINNKETLDIIEIDAASNNGVEEIRELRSKVSLVPSNSKYKIYIIDEVHMLTVAAFNALLKTLEEPPSHIIFILATTEVHKIPETILSRCQKFDFKRLHEQDIFDRIKQIAINEKIDIDDSAILEIARLSNGGMRDSIGMLEQVSAYSLEKITVKEVHDINGSLEQKDLLDFIEYLINNDVEKLMNKIDFYSKEGKNLIIIIEDLILFLRNCLLILNVPKYFENKKDVEIYNVINNKLKSNDILKIINFINESLIEIRKYSNSKILFEIMIINIVEEMKKNNISLEHNDFSGNNIEKPLKKVKNIQKSQLNVENTQKKQKDLSEKNTLFGKLKEKRINNTFSSVSKNLLLDTKKQLIQLHSFIVDNKYKDRIKLISLILDGNIRAAGHNNLIFVYENELLSDCFNKNIVEIEKILGDLLERKYFVIALSIDEWDIYRDEFKSKKKKYEYTDDTIELKEYLSSINHKTENKTNMFADLIEIK